MSGAMDRFGERGHLMANIDTLLAFRKGIGQFSVEGQGGLFDFIAEKPKSILSLADADPAPMKQKLAWERELLGLYISGHPLDEYAEQVARTRNTLSGLVKRKKDKKALVVAHIDIVRLINTKANNARMAFVTLSDKTGTAEAVVFPESYKEVGDKLKEGTVVAIQCDVSERQDRVTIMIDKIKVLS